MSEQSLTTANYAASGGAARDFDGVGTFKFGMGSPANS
ncbi:uncharacterized protein METZ01_LOCUS281486, partial [marine metagenome]